MEKKEGKTLYEVVIHITCKERYLIPSHSQDGAIEIAKDLFFTDEKEKTIYPTITRAIDFIDIVEI